MGEGDFKYRADVLEALLGHGVAPSAATPPGLVRDFVSDLYRFEIRCLKRRLMAGDFPRNEYAARVIALRNRYRVLSMRASDWIET